MRLFTKIITTTYHTFPFYNYKLVKAIKVTAILYNESER